MDKIPYSRCEALPQGRTFPAPSAGSFNTPNQMKLKISGLM